MRKLLQTTKELLEICKRHLPVDCGVPDCHACEGNKEILDQAEAAIERAKKRLRRNNKEKKK